MKSKVFVLGLVLLLLSGMLLAQSDRASITGTVKDSSGAVIPGVQVTATNIATNAQSKAVTNDLGLYTILNLPIGTYSVTFSKDGFKGFERKGLTLQVSQIAEINSVLQVGTTSETVTVTEDAPMLQTQSAAVSTNLRNNVVTDLPLSVAGGRSLSNFMFAYVPGVEGSDYDSHINGSVSKSKEVMIDGTSAISQIGGFISESQPPMEAVEEFQVSTAGIRADEGRSGGGVFRYVTKSGTNTWHGSGFYNMQNEAFNANSASYNYHLATDPARERAAGHTEVADFLTNLYSRPETRLYNYGGSIGGPIRKDKTFFFFSHERYSKVDYSLGGLNGTAPTSKMLGGDFSELLNLGATLGTDPCGQTIYQGAIFNPKSNGCVFVGNVIPTDQLSKASMKIADLYRQYYKPLVPGLTNNNAMPANQPAPWYHINQYFVKLDHNINERHHFNGSFIFSDAPRYLADQGGIWSAGSTDGGPMANYYQHYVNAPSVRLSETWTVTPNVVNVVNATLNRFYNPSYAVSQKGNWPSALGIGDYGAGNFPIIKMAGINSDESTWNGVRETNLGSQFNDFYTANTLVFNDNLSWVRGRHTYKFGAEFRAMQFNSHGDYGVPQVVFSKAQTSNGMDGTGFGFASFMLGYVNQMQSVSEVNNTYGRRKALSLYAQDDIKVNSKLTVNMDLRWDFNGHYHEKFGHWSSFNTTAINPVTGQPGALEFLKDGSDSFDKTQYWLNFAPHIGAAYQVTPKTVARASFGVMYVPLNLNTWGGIPYGFNPGYALNNTYGTPYYWDNGYPGKAEPVAHDPNFTRWGMVSIDPRALMPGNVQQWTAGVQREITNDLKLDVSYIQSRGYHLQSGVLRGNQPKMEDYTAMVKSGMWNWVTKPGYNNWSGFAWAAVTPFPTVASTWGPLFYVGNPDGNSDYQSLQFNVTKRASHGLSLQASYNYSKAHGDASDSFQELWGVGSIQDIYALDKERHVILPYDQTHIVKGYVTYELPLGKGKTFLSSAGEALNALVGGWTVSSAFHYNTGTPMQINGNDNWYPGFSNPVRANIAANCDISRNFDGKLGGTYFNPACFSNPVYGEFGNAPTYMENLRGFGLATEDLGVNKYFKFGQDGRFKLNVRFEMFNVFNRHGFKGPETGINNSFKNASNPYGNFGQVTDYAGGPRVGQLGARFTW